ncbi:MAG: hypothetical protein A2V66_02000 [Ignavibacteria bacterium RBG_13_36_8]|nr:MAG: hypothetical protein A2V66_02000 [Ignavibacteria bacterium RBG_13_36_8]
MFKNYFKIAYRNILKNKIYSAINILGFAVGLAAFILISLYVQYEFSYDKYHENADRIYRVVRDKPGMESEITKTAVTPAPLAPLLVDEFPEVISATRIIQTNNQFITYGKEIFLEEKIHWSDPETFNLFTIPLIKGNKKTVLNDPYSVLLSESTAKKYFGEDDPIGKSITYQGQYDFRVTGIFYDMPANSHFVMNIIFPYKTYFQFINREVTSWEGNFSYTYIFLQQNTNAQELTTKFPEMLNKYIYDKYNLGVPDKFKEILTLQLITDIHLHSQRNQEMEANGDYTIVLLLLSLAVLFLIIACINYMNLSTAKSGQRGREVGLRKVVGAHRSQLIRQFFGESMMMIFSAFIISIIIVLIFLPSFNQFVDRPLSLNPSGNSSLLGGLILLVLLVGLFAGSYPALLISGFSPISVLRGTFTRTSKGSILRNLLVLIQFAITIIFLTFTFIVREQIQFIQNKDVGYDKEQIVILKIQNNNIIKNLDAIKAELLRNPGVVKASASYRLPNNIDEHQGVIPPGKDPSLKFMIYYNYADYDFVDLYGIEIVKGRNFSKEFPSDQNGVFLVNEAAVKAAQWENPIGQEFMHYSGINAKIVGVMKDFNLHSLHRTIEPAYIFFNQSAVSYLSIKIIPTNIPQTLKHIESVMKEFSPGYPFEYTFFDEVFAAAYTTEQKMGTLFSAFSILAVIVACLGLFGLASFAAENRTKEIGIRKSLGASVSNIFILLSKEFLRWILLANIIAWPLAYYFMRGWLDDFAYHIDLGFGVFVLSGIIALFIALITVSRQALKAAKTNPVDSLKYE